MSGVDAHFFTSGHNLISLGSGRRSGCSGQGWDVGQTSTPEGIHLVHLDPAEESAKSKSFYLIRDLLGEDAERKYTHTHTPQKDDNFQVREGVG